MMVEEPGEEPGLQETLEGNTTEQQVVPSLDTSDNGAVEVRMLTLNIWGIPGVSKNRLERLDAICQQISSAAEPYHFVMLQEVWSTDDYNLMVTKLKTCLPYSHFFHSGVIGSGLCMFSVSPLTSAHFHPWSVNGLPHKVYHGDWWGGKGVALCTTCFQGCNIVLATTHLHAVYQHLQDEYLHHRVVQAYETSQVLHWSCPPDHTLLMGGDLNCEHHEVPYRLVRYNAGLRDAFLEAPNKPVDGIGATNETPGNSYTSLAALRQDPTGKRIDHILYRPAHNAKVKVKLCDLPWPLRVPGTAYSFSDHEAVRTVLHITPGDKSGSSDDTQLSSNGPSPHRFLPQQHSLDSSAMHANGNGSVTTKLAAATTNTSAAVSGRRGTAHHTKALTAASELTHALHQQTDTLLDSAAICSQGMRAIDSSKRFYCFLSAAMTIINLILIGVVCDAGKLSGGVVFVLLMLLLLSVLVTFYCFWLVLIWNRIERNAVLATQLGLECLLEDLRKKNAVQFQRASLSNLEKSGAIGGTNGK